MAIFAARLNIRTPSLAEVMRITSSVNETVTEIASASLNNLENRFLLALSYRFLFGLASAINSRATFTADFANSSTAGSVAIGLITLASALLI